MELPDTMRTSTLEAYGHRDVLAVDDVPVPLITPRTVLVRVVAAGVNPLDWHMMTGTPWLVRLRGGIRKPASPVLGVDMAGRVAAVGTEVTALKPGDEVVGVTASCFAEYVATSADSLSHLPEGVAFDQAVGAGVAGITALQGLRDRADLSAGQHVLINGASGGVGTAAIQLAKRVGADVTAVCSTRNVDMVTSLGADHVVDYTAEDFTHTDQRYDVIFDNQSNRKLRQIKRILADEGTYVLVGGSKNNTLVGPMAHMLHAVLRFKFSNQTATAFIASGNQRDTSELLELIASGELRTVIDTTYSLDELPEAMDHIATGHVSGKLVINP